MAFTSWYSSRRRYGSRYGRYSRKRYSSRRRRTFGNFRAANQQRDAATVVLNTVINANVAISEGQTAGSTFVNIWNYLYTHPFFPNYSGMYDQMHLDGVRAKITGSIQGTNATSYLTPTVVTAWDRNGFDTNSTGSVTGPTPEDVASYSSAITKAWSLGNNFTMNRSIYPSIMAEKSQYVSPLSLLDVGSNSPANSVDRNPVQPGRSPSIPFKPQLLLAVTAPTGATVGGQTFTFAVELDIQVTFRGLRKGPVQA